MLKNIYKWHRTTSLIIAIPVLLWAASGFMHPIMTTVRPKLSTQFLVPNVMDSTQIVIPLEQSLKEYKIESIYGFRIIHILNNYFYQIKQTAKANPIYISTKTGKILGNGDWIYAQYLAQQFLEGPQKDTSKRVLSIKFNESTDCCEAATDCVLNKTKGVKIIQAIALNNFTNEYKSINKLLPVYKVSFDRPDGIRIYVETGSDRFAFAVDNKRAVFDKFFMWFHNWSWLNFLGKGRLVFEVIIMILAFLTTIMGIYIFFTTRSKKADGNIRVKARRNHRFTSIAISVFTLMFTFSGGFHAYEKLIKSEKKIPQLDTQIQTRDIKFELASIRQIVKKPIIGIRLVQINKLLFWQVNTIKEPPLIKRKDLMKDKTVPTPNAIYINVIDNIILPDGEKKYARYLATKFSGNNQQNIQQIVPITKFEGEYGFVNKRLPVFKVSYACNNNERYYVETATSEFAAEVNDKDVLEGYSFSLLHKHHFMNFANKSIRDFSTMFWAMAQIAMVIIGLILYSRMRKNRS